jgi:hypothetical protein
MWPVIGLPVLLAAFLLKLLEATSAAAPASESAA